MMIALKMWTVGVLLACIAPMFVSAQSGGASPSLEASRGPTWPTPQRAQDTLVPPLDRRVTLDMEGTTIGTALQELVARTGVKLIYSGRVVPLSRRVTVQLRNASVKDALAAVLRGTEIEPRAEGDRVLLVRTSASNPAATANSSAVVGIVFGTVTDSATGDPVANAIVSVKGTAIRAATSDRGRYQLGEVPSGPQVVMTRLLGYLPLEKEVTVTDDRRARVDFALMHSPSRLQEVVMTATGPRRRLELGNDITILNADSIVATQPVASVTDLLEGRVPGLVVQRSSGAPGDPSRIRLRGASSPRLSNDPIVIVDGVRVYGDQSDDRSGNLAGSGAENYATPSPLDYIDPNSIETIEVIKGPSAATLYGQDAANGVIVVTTKKGRVGPARWTVSAEQGVTRMPGSYPDLHFRWGHQLGSNNPVFCPVSNIGFFQDYGSACIADSLVTFQLLNDPALTVLDRGNRSAVTLGVSGGSNLLTYSLTGSYRDEVGLVKLPAFEAERYEALQGSNPPDWMQRPQNLKRWGATSRLTARLGATADVSLTGSLSRTEQQRSSLERQLGNLMGTYLDRTSGTYYRAHFGNIRAVDQALTEFYERATAAATQFTNGASLNWRPFGWLTATADAGLNVIQRADEIFLPRAQRIGRDSIGRLGRGQGTSLMSTVNIRTLANAPLGRGLKLQFATGVNYTGTSIADLTGNVENLAAGTNSVNRAGTITNLREGHAEQATFGWYVEPSISHRRFWLSSGIRLDGGSTFGTRLRLPSFPKLSLSYLISDEPFFPLKNVLPVLRLRAAYGEAGRQPGPTDRLRLYTGTQTVWTQGRFVPAVTLQTLGNTLLKPEHSKEMEGGFDADLLDDRLSVGFTSYRKTTSDALLSVPLPPSLYGRGVSVIRNIGVIRNTGVDFTLGAQPVRSDLATLATQLSVSRRRNVVVALGPGVEPFYTDGDNVSGGIRVAAGYPLFGRWVKPVLGYADGNGNGVLEPEEVLLGDTAVYVGQTLPNYTATLHTTLSLLSGALSVSAGLLYDDGLTQRNEVAERLAPFSRGWNDPDASLAEQAATGFNEYTWIQTVSTLRFNSLSMTYNLAPAMAERVGARALSVSLQGTNLGLRTNYRGLDPSVNARATGNSVTDTGVLPQPRTWQVRINATY